MSMHTPIQTGESSAQGPSTAYSPLRPPGPIDLHLDANETLIPSVDVASIAADMGLSAAARYPSAAALEAAIALRLGVEAARVLVTAGGDEAIDRACRAFLKPGAELILPVPTFEMIERYAQLTQAKVIPVPWREGPFPTQAVIDQVNQRTAMIAIVSPNNPTGAVAQAEDLQKISASAPHAKLLVDLAYEEFAENPLTPTAMNLPNATIIRTFSKAFGLAGLRVGYAVASESAISAMRIAGSPYSVSALSIAAAQNAFALPDAWLDESVAGVRAERAQLQQLLRELGAIPLESQGNFVLAQFPDAVWVWRALAGVGISVRRFAAEDLQKHLRITCPGSAQSFARLRAALRSALSPETIILAFDRLQGSDIESLKRLSSRVPISLITRKSRAECEIDLSVAGMQSVFTIVVGLEDFPSVEAAIQSVLRQQKTPHGWMLCDSMESIASSRCAGLVPLAFTSNDTDASELVRSGAARVLTSLSQLEGMLP